MLDASLLHMDAQGSIDANEYRRPRRLVGRNDESADRNDESADTSTKATKESEVSSNNTVIDHDTQNLNSLNKPRTTNMKQTTKQTLGTKDIPAKEYTTIASAAKPFLAMYSSPLVRF